MVRTIITPTKSDVLLSIPKEYIGKPIEVTVISLEESEQKPSKKTMGDFWGIISDETAKLLHEEVEQNRREW